MYGDLSAQLREEKALVFLPFSVLKCGKITMHNPKLNSSGLICF